MDSIQSVNLMLLIAAALVLIGIVSSLVARRFGAPLLFVFLVLGMVAGEDGPGGLVFNDYRATYLVGSFALAVILFDGGLRTRVSGLKGALAPSAALATLGVVVTAVIAGGAAWLVIDDLSPLEAWLVGSIVASTDAAAVFFLLRAGGLRLRGRIGTVLEMESSTNDPVAMFMTIALTEILLAGGQTATWVMLSRLAEQAAWGVAIGLGSGFAAVFVLNRIAMPTGLHPLFVVASAVLVYAVTSAAGGSGLLAVYLAGLVFGNRPVRAYPSIVGFHDAATWLCQIVMFLVLGLLVTPSSLVRYALPGLAVAVLLTLVARPAAVWLCLLPFRFDAKEKLFVSWVGLRGAVSIFLAAIPMLSGLSNAAVYFNVAFFVVLVSLLVQGWSINAVALRLGMALRRTTPSVHRTELDIPGQTGRELVGYPIVAESLVLLLSKLPEWARVLLVVRDNEILDGSRVKRLRAGDYAYFLVPPERVPRLDRIVSPSSDVTRRVAHLVGEFAINGDAVIGEIDRIYELGADEEDRGRTVDAFFGARLKAPPVPGQRQDLGKGTLVVRAVENGIVVRAGLLLEELVDDMIVAEPPRRRVSWPRPGRLRALLKRPRRPI